MRLGRTRVEAQQHAGACAVVSVLLRGWETFLDILKAGPAGGRLRRPSSAGACIFGREATTRLLAH
jgi:hypothetical protein